MKDEALKLALEALELHGKQYPHMVKGYCLDAITAIKQALAAPVQEPVVYCDLENWLTGKVWADDVFSNIQHKGWSPLYTTPPAAQPAVPDAMTSADIQEHIEYVAGWNDCRAAMLEILK